MCFRYHKLINTLVISEFLLYRLGILFCFVFFFFIKDDEKENFEYKTYSRTKEESRKFNISRFY